MIYFIVALVFAVIQFCLLKTVLENITAGNRGKSIKYFLIKFILYGLGIMIFVLKYAGHVAQISCGFVAGFPISAFIYFIYVSYIKEKYGDSFSKIIKNIKKSLFKKKSFRI